MDAFHRNLMARGKGAKNWANSFTEVEHLGNGKFAASIGVGHRVFKDKADGKWKKHKLTDERPSKDYILIQSAKCCIEVHPHYAKYFDVNHEEVRLHEERWVVQRLFKAPDTWRDVDAHNPIMKVEEYSEPAGDVVKVTVTYDTDYGNLTVEYFQRDGNALKHNVAFKNTSGGEEAFRVLQRWSGIVGTKCNGKDFPLDVDEPFLSFHRADKPKKKFTIAENLHSMLFNPDGTEKTEKCLQIPVTIESHAQGMKSNFVYGNWVLANGESLAIDPGTATLNDPTEDGYVKRGGYHGGGLELSCAACPTYAVSRETTTAGLWAGGRGVPNTSQAYRAYIEWNVSSLAGATLTANPVFKYHGVLDDTTDLEINPLTEEAPSDATDANLWGYIASGSAYIDPFTIEVGAGKSVDLGASAKTDLQTAVTAGQSWFAIGYLSAADECPCVEVENYGYVYSEEKTDPAADPKPTLYVEYILWTGKISGVTNPAKVAGVAVGTIAKVKGVA